MGTRHTVINAIVGAVVGIVLSFLPFSTLLGGVASGFLEGPDARDGTLAGAIAGLIMFVPLAIVGFLLLGVLGFGFGLGGLPIEGFVVFLFVLGFVAFVAFVYTVGLAALGGYLGAYLAGEYPHRHASTRDAIGMGDAERSGATRRRRTRDSPDRSEPVRWREDEDDRAGSGPDRGE